MKGISRQPHVPPCRGPKSGPATEPIGFAGGVLVCAFLLILACRSWAAENLPPEKSAGLIEAANAGAGELTELEDTLTTDKVCVLKVQGKEMTVEVPLHSSPQAFRGKLTVLDEAGSKIGEGLVRQFGLGSAKATFYPATSETVVRPGCRVVLNPHVTKGSPTTNGTAQVPAIPHRGPAPIPGAATLLVMVVDQSQRKVKVSGLPRSATPERGETGPIQSLLIVDETNRPLGRFIPASGEQLRSLLKGSAAWGEVRKLQLAEFEPSVRPLRVGDRVVVVRALTTRTHESERTRLPLSALAGQASDSRVRVDTASDSGFAGIPLTRNRIESSMDDVDLPVSHFDSLSANVAGGNRVTGGYDYTDLKFSGRELRTNARSAELGLFDRIKFGRNEHETVVVSGDRQSQLEANSTGWEAAFQVDKDVDSASALQVSRQQIDAQVTEVSGGSVSKVTPSPTEVWMLTAMHSDRLSDRKARHFNLVYARTKVAETDFVAHTLGGRVGLDIALGEKWQLQATGGMYVDLFNGRRTTGTLSGALGYEIMPDMQLQLASFLAPRGLPIAGSFFTEASALNANRYLLSDTVRKVRDSAIGSIMLRLILGKSF